MKIKTSSILAPEIQIHFYPKNIVDYILLLNFEAQVYKVDSCHQVSSESKFIVAIT